MKTIQMINSIPQIKSSNPATVTKGVFLSGQSDRIEILFGPESFLALQKLTSAIGLAMFCKQRKFGTPRTVHHTKSLLKLSFYRSI